MHLERAAAPIRDVLLDIAEREDRSASHAANAKASVANTDAEHIEKRLAEDSEGATA
jgi:hypothetical protein